MSKPTPRHPSVPPCDDPTLDAISIAISRRARAICYHTNNFGVTREFEADHVERLNIDVDTLEERPTHVRLSLWSDGSMWLGVHQPGPKAVGGWEFAYVGSGNHPLIDATTIVALLEATLKIAYGPARTGDAAARIEQAWIAAGLQAEA